jgi:hypothetical protein
MKKRYRKVRNIWVVTMVVLSSLSFIWSFLTWRSISSMIALSVGFALFGCAMWLANTRWEVK